VQVCSGDNLLPQRSSGASYLVVVARAPNVPASGGEGRQRLRTEANRTDGGGGGVKRFARG